MAQWGVFRAINGAGRNSSVDLFRSLAIIAVVLFHFNHTLPYGHLGVDLFFVISGLLVGGILTREFKDQGRVHYARFILQRGFKIWPSYYTYVLLGTLLAIWFYRDTDPHQIIPLREMKYYLLFYQNYVGGSFHWSFGHLWSLCVEEHFYVALPLMFLLVGHFAPPKHRTASLFVLTGLAILSGICFKHISYFYTASRETYIGTHNRIDALAWGVLLNLILTHFPNSTPPRRRSIVLFGSGVVLLTAALITDAHAGDDLFNKLYLHSITPIAFFLMLWGSHHTDLSRLTPLRFIAYYSYNWYLWHPIFSVLITRHLGDSLPGLILYLLVTFGVAMLATMLVEEPFLRRRSAVLARLFGR